MTSRRPYWCPKTMKRRPCRCPKTILWELNSFLLRTLPFVPINLHRCWPRDFTFTHLLKRSIIIIIYIALSLAFPKWYRSKYVSISIQSGINLKNSLTVLKPYYHCLQIFMFLTVYIEFVFFKGFFF